MHYYTKNIADFNNATRHLTRQERSIYSDLIELQYDLETPLPDDLDWICRRILASTESERTDVERMLNEYFDHVEQGWSNARCEAEIRLFQSKRENAVRAGKASGEARKRNKKPNKNNEKEQKGTDVERTLNERSTNVEPTNNQEPITNNHNRGRFTPPKVSEVAAYCRERGNGIDAQSFVDFYTANGWVQGKGRKPVRDWMACVRTWEKNRSSGSSEEVVVRAGL